MATIKISVTQEWVQYTAHTELIQVEGVHVVLESLFNNTIDHHWGVWAGVLLGY